MEEKNNDICYYCGAHADVIDHVIPKCILRSIGAVDDTEIYNRLLGKRMLLVPACRECNNLLGATYQSTVKARKKFLKQKLKIRYKKLLKMPDWNIWELNHLNDNLRSYIISSLEQRTLIKERLRW